MEKEVTPFLEVFLPVDLKGNEMESLQWEQVAPLVYFPYIPVLVITQSLDFPLLLVPMANG